jgi:hypothetical protein
MVCKKLLSLAVRGSLDFVHHQELQYLRRLVPG